MLGRGARLALGPAARAKGSITGRTGLDTSYGCTEEKDIEGAKEEAPHALQGECVGHAGLPTLWRSEATPPDLRDVWLL